MRAAFLIPVAGVLLAVVLIAFGGPATAPAQDKGKPAAAVKWEYKHVDLNQNQSADEADDELNKLGGDGWELVSTYTKPNTLTVRYVLKRPKK